METVYTIDLNMKYNDEQYGEFTITEIKMYTSINIDECVIGDECDICGNLLEQCDCNGKCDDCGELLENCDCKPIEFTNVIHIELSPAFNGTNEQRIDLYIDILNKIIMETDLPILLAKYDTEFYGVLMINNNKSNELTSLIVEGLTKGGITNELTIN